MKLDNFSRALFCAAALTIAIIGGTFETYGKDPVPTFPNPLPRTAPAPNILMRESFGPGPDFYRPAGGSGQMKPVEIDNSVNGYWLEYPGTKNNRWITADNGETWRFCGMNPNPYELPTPLEPYAEDQNTTLCTYLNSTILDVPRPTALIPLAAAGTGPYEVGIDGHYGYEAFNTHFALGLTGSATTVSNLRNAGQIVLVTRPADPNSAFIQYELRQGGFNGTLLTTGVVEDDDNFIRLRIKLDPQTRTVSASIKGMEIGTFPTTITNPRYAAFEGYGYADNFTVTRQ